MSKNYKIEFDIPNCLHDHRLETKLACSTKLKLANSKLTLAIVETR